MLKTSLLNEFNLKLDSNEINYKDYDIFKNKEKLDTLRSNILEKLGDLTYLDSNISKDIILSVINEETKLSNLSNLERSHLYNIIDSEINGYGPITELLSDENISEIMVNGVNDIYISINGEIIKDEGVSFINNDHIIRTIKKMLKNTNINLEKERIVTTKLHSGDIITIIMPPLSLTGPVFTIKKQNKAINNMDELLKIGTLTPFMARFLNAAVVNGLNILICGASSSGKTSLLNSLGNLEDSGKRIICIEKVQELDINKENVIKLNIDNEDKIFNQVLKMHPNTIILGNLESNMISDILDIMNNKSTNVLTSIVANGPLQAINKLEEACLNNEMNSRQIRNKLYSVIDLIVTIEEMKDYRHKITSIAEFNKNKNDDIVLKEIFSYKEKEIINGEISGEFSLSKYIPRSYLKIKNNNYNDIDDIFE